MVESKEKLQQRYMGALGALEKINDSKNEGKKCSRTVELFFSFDIVNSSAYKDENYFGWPVVLTSLLTEIQRSVAGKIPQAQLWRVLGDEIIFFVTIKNIDEIYAAINSVYSTLVNFNLQLRTGRFFENLENNSKETKQFTESGCIEKTGIDMLRVNNIIAVQAAAWLAIVINGDKEEFRPYDNVFKLYNINESQPDS